MTGIRPYQAAALALLAATLTVQPAEPTPLPSVSVPTPSVRPSIPRPDTSGAVNSATRGAIDAARTKSSSGNKGADGGKASGSGSAASGPPPEVAAQQAVIDHLQAEYKKYGNVLLQLPFNGGFWTAHGELTKAQSNLADARKLHGEMRDRYLKDPTADNDKLVKTAEQAIFAAEKQVDVKQAKKDEIQKGLELTEKQTKERMEQINAQYQKEADKLDTLKIKYDGVPAVNVMIRGLLFQ